MTERRTAVDFADAHWWTRPTLMPRWSGWYWTPQHHKLGSLYEAFEPFGASPNAYFHYSYAWQLAEHG